MASDTDKGTSSGEGDVLGEATDEDLTQRLLNVCGSQQWVAQVLAGRPYTSVDALVTASGRAVLTLDRVELLAALAGHLRIGERKEGLAHLTSRREQAGVDATDTALKAHLAEGNRQYEERFGHVYLARASGRSGSELLELLRKRLANDPVTEEKVVRHELAQINALRLAGMVAT